MPKKYNHACDIAFEVESDLDYPTRDEIMTALKDKVSRMEKWDDENIELAVDVYDTYEND